MRCQPVLRLPVVLGRSAPAPARPFPLDEKNVAFTFSGTAAIYQAFRALNLPPGATVLCPSYNCGHEIEPLARLGLRVECYRITSALEIDFGDLERRLRDAPRAVLVTHYFGFAQPLAQIRALCDRYGARLVEDCAHALLSNDETGTLGRVGDVAVYSMRKTLPLPNGGAVLFNDSSLSLRDEQHAPAPMSTWLKSLDLVKKSALDVFLRSRAPRDLVPLMGLLPLVAGSRVIELLYPRSSKTRYNPDDESFAFDTAILSWGMSEFSAELLGKIDWSRVVAQRQNNYRALASSLQGIEGFRVLLPNLPPWTCPLYFPLVAQRRPVDVYNHLARRRIYADVFWEQEHRAVDWDRYPEARGLKRQMLALPVHQDVDADQIEHLAEALRSL
jgi:dTDP-4-amino-4,6-dideoxygalactose transaminase